MTLRAGTLQKDNVSGEVTGNFGANGADRIAKYSDIPDVTGFVTDAELNQEISDREAADTILAGDIAEEALARAQADTVLQDAIDAEETARESADTTLQNNIAAETDARQSADVVLQDQIDTLSDATLSYFQTEYGTTGWTSPSTYVNASLAGKTFILQALSKNAEDGGGIPAYQDLRDGAEYTSNPSGGFTLSAGWEAETGSWYRVFGAGVVPADVASLAEIETIREALDGYFDDVITGETPVTGTGTTFVQVRSSNMAFPFNGNAKLFEAWALVGGSGVIKFYSVSGTLWTKVAESPPITVPGTPGLFSVPLDMDIQAGWVYGWYSTGPAVLTLVSGGRRSLLPANGEGSGITTAAPTSYPLMRITVETVQKVKDDIDDLQNQLDTVDTEQTTQDASILVNTNAISASPSVNYWPYQFDDFSTTDYVDNAFTVGNYSRDWIAIGNMPAIRLAYISASNIKRRIRIDNIADFADGDIAFLTLEINATKFSSSNGGVKLVWTDDSNTTLAADVNFSRPTAANTYMRVRTPGLARPVSATRLWLWVEFNTVTTGDSAIYCKWSITKNFAVPANSAISVKDIDEGPKAIGVLTTSIIYMSPQGLDTGTGSTLLPVLTMAKALSLVGRKGHIHLLYGTNGIYTDTTLNSFMPLPELNITCDQGVVVKCGTAITGWTKTGGYNYIYQTAFTFTQTDQNIHKIYEETVNPAYAITRTNWYPQMGSATHALPFWVINRVESAPDTANYHTTGVRNTALAEMDASPLGLPLFYYDYVNSILYLVCSDRGDPTSKTIIKPSQNKYYLQGSSSSDYNPGKISIYNLETRYAGFGDMKCEAVFNSTTVCGSYIDGYYPSGNFQGYNISARGCGNDGFSPHSTQNEGQRGSFNDIRVEGSWFEANWDEGISGHYWSNRDRYINCLVRYSEHGGGITPAGGAKTDIIDCVTIGNGVYGGGGGVTVLGGSGEDCYCNVVRHTSIDEAIGLDDRSVSGILNAKDCLVMNPTTQGYKNINNAIDCRIYPSGATVGTITNKITSVPV